MRKILSLITVYFVISCSSFLAQAQESDAAIVILFEVGGSETDEAFVEMAQAGARRAKTELGARYVTRSIAPTEDRETVFRGAIAQGKRLLIALGFQHVPVIMKLAKEFPNVYFTVVDGQIPPLFNNVQSVVFRDNEGAFLVGMIAAMQSKTGTIGFIGGMDVPIIRDFAYGYRQGAEYAKPDITLLQEMIGTTPEAWSNPQKAARIAQRYIAQGADVIFAAAGGSSIGMLEKVSHYENVYGIGVDTNQNATYPGTVLTSLVKRVDKAVYNSIAQFTDNSWTSGMTYLGIAEGALDYAVDVHNRELLNRAVVSEVEQTKDYIAQGLVKVEPYRVQ